MGHSYSKIIHEKIADYTYELLPLPTEAEGPHLYGKARLCGHQRDDPRQAVCHPLLRRVVDPKAQAIGAVNTIVNRDGNCYGYNTDYAGFAYLAGAHGVDFAGKTVLVRARAVRSTVTAVCRDGGAKEILTASRTGKGRCPAVQRGHAPPGRADHRQHDALRHVPRTWGSALSTRRRSPALEAVLDVVYNPFRTELLLRAEDCGVTAAGGFEMLVAQAVFAAEHFTGRQLDTAAIIPAVSRELRHQLAECLDHRDAGLRKIHRRRGAGKAP